jgi:hypothetical protein
MINDYREVVAVLKDRGRVLLLRIGLFRIVLSGNPRFSANFYRHRRGLNWTRHSLVAAASLREDIGPIRFGTMNDYCEVIARKCKIPDPSLAVDWPRRASHWVKRAGGTGSATLAYRYRTPPTTIRQCVAGLRLDSDRFCATSESDLTASRATTERWRHCWLYHALCRCAGVTGGCKEIY